MLTPGRSPAATMSATPVASHEASSGNSLKRGRSGRHAVDFFESDQAIVNIQHGILSHRDYFLCHKAL